MNVLTYARIEGAGYCQCGCGQRTGIAHRNHRSRGWIKGQPKQYIQGHNGRKRRPAEMSNDGTARIPLARRDGSIVAYAAIDACDANLADFPWYLGSRGYAMRQYKENGRNRAEFLHRRVLGLKPDDPREADHINRDKLDNRRVNLRAVTRSQNEQNKLHPPGSSGYKNVVWYGRANRWAARLKVDGKWKIRTGFPTPEAAAVVAEQLRREWHPCAPSERLP